MPHRDSPRRGLRRVARRPRSSRLAAVPSSGSAAAGQGRRACLRHEGAAHIRDEYLADLDTVHVKIVALANAIPADKYSWRPTAGVRSVSEALMHVASEWWFYGPRSIGGKEPADFGAPKEKLPALEKITSKAEVARSAQQIMGAFAGAAPGRRSRAAHRQVQAVGHDGRRRSVRHGRRPARTPRPVDRLLAVGRRQAAVEQVVRTFELASS